jgi:hypothetical protein
VPITRERVYQTGIVDSSNPILMINHAYVAAEGAHSTGELPCFGYDITDSLSNSIATFHEEIS